MTLFLLQAATAVASTSNPSVGEWIAASVAFLTVLGGAFKVGALAQRVSGFERDVVKKLDEFIASSNEARQSWAGWRATTESRLGRVEQDQQGDKEARHDMRNSVNETLSDHEKRLSIIEGDRRAGPPDRRQS